MNKIKYVLFVLGLFISLSAVCQAELIPGGYGHGVYFKNMTSSGVVSDTPVSIIKIILSSAVENTVNARYAVVYDSAPRRENIATANWGGSTRISPPLVFLSSTTATNLYGWDLRNEYIPNFSDGVRVSSGIYYFPTHSAEGEAQRALFILKKD